jgi:hypothetical protein
MDIWIFTSTAHPNGKIMKRRLTIAYIVAVSLSYAVTRVSHLRTCASAYSLNIHHTRIVGSTKTAVSWSTSHTVLWMSDATRVSITRLRSVIQLLSYPGTIPTRWTI